MPNDAQGSYLESRILTADGVQLIQILYQAAIDATELARVCLESGDIAGRSNAISKAHAIVTELEVSLDREAGGEVGRSLRETYCYLRGRLVEANLEQRDAPLEEVARLLRVVLEAWQNVPADARPAAAGSGVEEPETPPEITPPVDYGWGGYSNSYDSAPPVVEYHVSVSC